MESQIFTLQVTLRNSSERNVPSCETAVKCDIPFTKGALPHALLRAFNLTVVLQSNKTAQWHLVY